MHKFLGQMALPFFWKTLLTDPGRNRQRPQHWQSASKQYFLLARRDQGNDTQPQKRAQKHPSYWIQCKKGAVLNIRRFQVFNCKLFLHEVSNWRWAFCNCDFRSTIPCSRTEILLFWPAMASAKSCSQDSTSEFIASISTPLQVKATLTSIWFSISNLETPGEVFNLLELEAAKADATGSHVYLSVSCFLLQGTAPGLRQTFPARVFFRSSFLRYLEYTFVDSLILEKKSSSFCLIAC